MKGRSRDRRLELLAVNQRYRARQRPIEWIQDLEFLPGRDRVTTNLTGQLKRGGVHDRRSIQDGGEF